MNLREAYQVLELQPGASEDEIRKSFKKLAARYHPDKNREPEAENLFKNINEAYQLLTNKQNQNQDQNSSGFRNDNFVSVDFGEIFSNFGFNFGDGFFGHNVSFNRPNITNEITISLSEALLGCNKSINIKRKIKCESTCNGTGKSIDYTSKCSSCSGVGRSSDGSPNPCANCGGRGYGGTRCSSCDGLGYIERDFEIKVQIPAGIESNQILKINGAPDYIFDKRMNRGVYIDTFVKINVEPEENMHVSGPNVISTIELTLLEALKGAVKKVKTIRGDLSLKINKNIKNGDKIQAKGYGAGGVGSHIFIIQVNYPEDCDKIISLLEEQEKE